MRLDLNQLRTIRREIEESSNPYRNSDSLKSVMFAVPSAQFSPQSVVYAMERFSRAVANMDETVMVPCKLMDVPVGSDPELDARVPRRSRAMIRDMQSADLHSLYTMLNSLKNELIWGTGRSTTATADNENDNTSVVSGSRSQQRSGMMVRPSSVNSMASISSTSSSSSTSGKGTSYSDSDSESGMMDQKSGSEEDKAEREEGEQDGDECVEQMARQFRRHLSGLHQCLEHMADSANYLTHRYQVEIGSAD